MARLLKNLTQPSLGSRAKARGFTPRLIKEAAVDAGRQHPQDEVPYAGRESPVLRPVSPPRGTGAGWGSEASRRPDRTVRIGGQAPGRPRQHSGHGQGQQHAGRYGQPQRQYAGQQGSHTLASECTRPTALLMSTKRCRKAWLVRAVRPRDARWNPP